MRVRERCFVGWDRRSRMRMAMSQGSCVRLVDFGCCMLVAFLAPCVGVREGKILCFFGANVLRTSVRGVVLSYGVPLPDFVESRSRSLYRLEQQLTIDNW